MARLQLLAQAGAPLTTQLLGAAPVGVAFGFLGNPGVSTESSRIEPGSLPPAGVGQPPQIPPVIQIGAVQPGRPVGSGREVLIPTLGTPC